MKNNPLVSILIPLYNCEEYIGDTIESCLNQTYENIEIIIVDDGSIDNSVKVVKEYLNKYNNIKLFLQNNSGASRARNLAFTKSKGKYIQYLDADDLMSANKISTQIEIAEKFNFDPNIIFSSKFSYFKDDVDSAKYFRQAIDCSYNSGIEWLIDAWSGGGFGVIMGWLTHRKLIQEAGPWDESLKKDQDGEFFSRVVLKTKKVIMADNTMVYYRRTGYQSISASHTEEAISSTLESLRKYKKNIANINNIKLKEAVAISYAIFIKEYHKTHPHITKKAEMEIEQLGFNINQLPYRGKFGHIVKLVGFYKAVKIQYLLQKARSLF